MTHRHLSGILLRRVSLVCLGIGSSLALSGTASARIGPKAVWNPSPDVIAKIRAQCSVDPAKLGPCFLQFMQSAGASSEARAFSKSLADTGYGYLRDFRDTGRVDIAYVQYVFRANEMQGVFLVNGDPPLIDVDDTQYASRGDQRKNPDYLALLQQYPRMSAWPGDRGDTRLPSATSSATRQEFDIEYRLRNGCHVCSPIGTEVLAFLFDDSGRFRATKILRVRPAASERRP